jgi:hypothetical protein
LSLVDQANFSFALGDLESAVDSFPADAFVALIEQIYGDPPTGQRYLATLERNEGTPRHEASGPAPVLHGCGLIDEKNV